MDAQPKKQDSRAMANVTKAIVRLLIAPFIAVPVAALVILGLMNFDLMVTIVGKLVVILVVIWF